MRRIAALAVLALAVSGCATPVLRPVCPTLKTYSKADQTALKAELDAHPDTPETHRWIGDYIGTRDQIRACQKGGV